jgi:hypothetical protein
VGDFDVMHVRAEYDKTFENGAGRKQHSYYGFYRISVLWHHNEMV